MMRFLLVVAFLAAAAYSATIDVTASNNVLLWDPPVVAIDPGDTVRWSWTDQPAHNVHSTQAGWASTTSLFDSGTPVTTGTFSFEFNNEGVYYYRCDPHVSNGMVGTIVVGNTAGALAPAAVLAVATAIAAAAGW